MPRRKEGEMSSSNSFSYESIQDTGSIKDFIKSLLDGLDNGKVYFSSNGDEIELHPSNMLKFAVKAKKKANTGKISIKISWKEGGGSTEGSEESIQVA